MTFQIYGLFTICKIPLITRKNLRLYSVGQVVGQRPGTTVFLWHQIFPNYFLTSTVLQVTFNENL